MTDFEKWNCRYKKHWCTRAVADASDFRVLTQKNEQSQVKNIELVAHKDYDYINHYAKE